VSTRARPRIPVAVAPGLSGCYAFLRCGAISRTLSPSSFAAFPTGAHMKLSISYKHVESHKPVEIEVERHVGKLGKLLQSYSPDLVQLHGAFSKHPRTDENSCSLNLSLPTGTRSPGEKTPVQVAQRLRVETQAPSPSRPSYPLKFAPVRQGVPY